MMERMKEKMQQHMGWDKDGLKGTKDTKVCNQSKTNNLFTTSQGQAPVQPFPKKQGTITFNSNLGIQTPSLLR